MNRKAETILMLLITSISVALAGPQQNQLIGEYESLARKQVADFSGFSVTRGETLYREIYQGGKADTPSCTTCHSNSPEQSGKTRAGKSIEPMALSQTPDRYSDFKKTEKWFRRNCQSVLGRECTPLEKGDFITFMIEK